jgi:formylmethanofuran dehydrogenase subunit D
MVSDNEHGMSMNTGTIKPFLELVLTTGRTLKQGIAMEKNKLGMKYEKEAGGIELDTSDADTLKASNGVILKVESAFGEVFLSCRISRNHHPGIAFIPMGPWANVLVDPETHGTGMPSYKNINIKITLAPNKKRTSITDLIKQLRSIKWEGKDE